MAHKGSPGGRQASGDMVQVLSDMWGDADKDGRQLLAGGKLALDALVS